MNVVNEETVLRDAVVAEVEEVESVEVDSEPDEIEATDSEEVAPEETPEEPSESSTEKKGGVQARIDELTKIRRETERERDYWKTLAQQPKPAPVAEQPGKTLSDFDYDEKEYATYLTNQATSQAQNAVRQEIAREQSARVQSEFQGKEADFSKDINDYHIVTRNPDLQMTGNMVNVCRDAENGPGLLYYLGKNPDVSSRLAQMEPLSMARELGRIEATKLSKQSAPPTKAPAPVPKIAATSNKVSVDPSKMTDSQFAKWRRAQIANR